MSRVLNVPIMSTPSTSSSLSSPGNGGADSHLKRPFQRHGGENRKRKAREENIPPTSCDSSPYISPCRSHDSSEATDEPASFWLVEAAEGASTPVRAPETAACSAVSSLKRRRHSYHNRSASPSPARGDNYGTHDGKEIDAKKNGEDDEEGAMRREVDDSLRGEENWDHPASMNAMCRRTLKIEYWDRSRECKERKWDHMDYIDATYASREEWILQSVLPRDEIVLEENKFPYNTPKGIRHMTLWARRELSLEEVESYMIDWIERERPGVRRWNLDENASRSIQVYHVHIYTQEVPDEEVGPSPSRGDAEDLDDHILSEDAKNGEESDPDDDLEHRSRPRHKAGSLGERRECCLIDGKENRMQAQTIMSGDETVPCMMMSPSGSTRAGLSLRETRYVCVWPKPSPLFRCFPSFPL